MSEQNYSDPLKMWKQMYDVNEKYWGKMMNDHVHKEEFSEWMGSVLDFNLFCKKMMNDQSKTFLDASNIASKEDIANVASLVINLESKVDTLEDQLYLNTQPELDVTALKKELDIVALKRDLTKVKAETKSIHQQVSELKSSMSNIEQLLKQLTTTTTTTKQ
ncbi:polyhydroxyalkanoic acid synthase subunit PhaR [Bacillus sp. AFS017336]|uniref:polyhydroxyalkanoic acid synthase subunit PhaR n=1 Tax=Bacillus sp. AFS017336 TaxID=2033489 RepID=UPI000BF1A6CC|nr:polyhydroxyalkanoic acid synthase subunit PhaR [Bacillus sp. AFS017336]PEL10540.1 polyhydroxyalkanoic acid synthase subunit PhaR [Bacillus sp. AFS017336]